MISAIESFGRVGLGIFDINAPDIGLYSRRPDMAFIDAKRGNPIARNAIARLDCDGMASAIRDARAQCDAGDDRFCLIDEVIPVEIGGPRCLGDPTAGEVVGGVVGLTLAVAAIAFTATAGAGALVGAGVAAAVAKPGQKPEYGKGAIIGAGALVGTLLVIGAVSK